MSLNISWCNGKEIYIVFKNVKFDKECIAGWQVRKKCSSSAKVLASFAGVLLRTPAKEATKVLTLRCSF
jgi:hypothetical protein